MNVFNKLLLSILVMGGSNLSIFGMDDSYLDQLTRRAGIYSDGIPYMHTNGRIYSAIFSPNGAYILAVDENSKLIVCNVKRGNQITVPGVISANFSNNGKFIGIIYNNNNTAGVLNLKTGKITPLVGHNGFISCIAFSPNCKLVATASYDKTVKIWNLNGLCKATLRGHTDTIRSVEFSHRGERLVTSSDDNTAKVWNLNEENNVISTLMGHSKTVCCATFSPNDKFIATASWDGTARIWNLSNGSVKTLAGHDTAVTSIGFSPNGRRTFTCSSNYKVKVWAVTTGACLTTLDGEQNFAEPSAFSRNGKVVIIGPRGLSAEVLDQNGNCLETLSDPTVVIYSIAINPNGDKVVTATGSNKVRVLNIDNK